MLLSSATPAMTFSVMDALQASPGMSQLSARVRLSQELLTDIRPLLPMALRPHVHAGPITDEDWCLLVRGNAASSKLRQLLPDIQARIRQTLGRELSVRIKILQPPG